MANPSTAAASQGPSALPKSHTKNGKNSRGKGAKNVVAAAASGVAPLSATPSENDQLKISDTCAASSASQTIDNIKANARAKILSTLNGDKPSAGSKDSGVVANGVALDLGAPVMSYSNKLKSRLKAKKTDALCDPISSVAQKNDQQLRVPAENGNSDVSSRIGANAVTSRVSGAASGSGADNKSPSPPHSGGGPSQAPGLKAGEHSSLNGGTFSDKEAAPVLPAQRSRARNRCRKRNGNKGNNTEEGVVANGAEGAQGSANTSSNGNCDTEVSPSAVSNGSIEQTKTNDKSTAQLKIGKQNQTSFKKKGNANKQKYSGAHSAAISNGVAGGKEQLQAKLQSKKGNNVTLVKMGASESKIQPSDIFISKESPDKILVGEGSETSIKENIKNLNGSDSPVRYVAEDITNLNVNAEVFVSMSDKASSTICPKESEGDASVLATNETASSVSDLTASSSADQSQNSENEFPKADLATAPTQSTIQLESEEEVTLTPTDAAATATPEESSPIQLESEEEVTLTPTDAAATATPEESSPIQLESEEEVTLTPTDAAATATPEEPSPIQLESEEEVTLTPTDAAATATPAESSPIQLESEEEVTLTPTDAAATATPEESTQNVPTGVTAASSAAFTTLSGIKLNPLACEFTPRFGGGDFLNPGDVGDHEQTFPSPDHSDEKQQQQRDQDAVLLVAAPSCGDQKVEEYASSSSYNGLSFGMSYLNMAGSSVAEEYNMQPWSEGHDYTTLPYPDPASLMPITPGNTSGHTSGTATPVLVYRNPPNTPATSAHLLMASSSLTSTAVVILGTSSTAVTQATTPSPLVYLPHHYHQNPGLYMDVVSRRLESHVQRQTTTSKVLTSASVSDKAECREGYYVEEQLPACSTISSAPLPITASVAGAEDNTNTSNSNTAPSFLEKASPVKESDTQEGLLEPVVDVVGESGDLSSSKDRKMEACLEKKSEETTGVKKECPSATVVTHLDSSATVEVVSNEAGASNASPVSDVLKGNDTPPSLLEVLPNSNGVAEAAEEAIPCSSETKRSDSVATSMSPETSPQMAPFTDTSAQPAAVSTVPAPLPGATVSPQLVLPVVQSTPLPNGEAGAEATAQPGTTGDPATDAIHKALTPHIQHLFNLKTFMNHPLIKDHLDGELYVTASHLLQIPEFQAITSSMELLTQALRNDPIDVEFDDNGNRVRCRNKRNVVIVRELSNTENTKEDIKTIFDCDDGSCPEVLHVEYANFSCWYIYFACENDAVTSLGFLNERRFKGRSVQAGIKSSQPTARVPYTPVKPNLPNGMGGSMPAQHQGPGSVGGQSLVGGGPPPPGGMYVGRPLPTSSASGVMPQQQQAPAAAGSGNSCAAPPASLMYSSHNTAVMHNAAAAAAAAAAAIYPPHYYNLPQPALFYPSPMMQHYNPAHGGFMDLGQFVTFNGLNPTSTYKPTGATQLQRFSSNVSLNNNGNKSRNRSRDGGQRTPASSAGPPTPQGGGSSSVHATYVPQPNPRLFGPPQSAASPAGGLQQQPLPYTSQPSHNANNSTLHYTNAYHAHMPPSFHHHHHHHQQQQHPVVSMAASVLPPASSANTSSAPSTTFPQQESTNVVPPHHLNASSNTSANNNNSCGSNSNPNSNSLANQYSSNTALISSSISNNNNSNNSNNANSPNSAPSPTSSSSLLREDSARSSPVHINNSRNKTSNTPPLLPCSSINNNSSSEGRSHNPNAPLISHPPLISQENAPLMAIPPQALHANSQNMPQHRNKYNNNMHFNSHHNNQRAQYSGQPGNMHHRNYPPYIYGQPNHYPMARDNMPARPMGRSSGGNGGGGGGGGNGGRSNRGRQPRPRDDDSHYHQMSGGGNSGGQMSGSHHQQQPQGGSGGPPPRMGGAPGGRSSTGGANGSSGANSVNNNSAPGNASSQQSIHPSNDSNASNSPSNNNVSNSNSRGNNSNSSRNQQLDRAAQHSSHDSKQAQFALESTSFPPLPGADESEPGPSIATDETAPAAAVAQVASQAVASESVTTPRANFAWGSDVSSTTNGQRFSDIMKKPRSEVAPLTSASSACSSSSKPDESTAGFVPSSSLDATLGSPGTSDVAPAVVTAAAIVANSNASAVVTSELAKSSSNSTAAEVVASASTTAVDSGSLVGAGSVGAKSTSAVAKDYQSQDVAASNRQSNNGAGGKEQRARGGRNRRGENAQQQPKTFNKNGSSGGAATGPLGKSQQQLPKQSPVNVQTLAPAKATNTAVSTSTLSSSVPASTPTSTDASSTAAPATTAPPTASREEKDPEAGNKELGDDDGWITKKTKEPRSHRNERKNAGMGHNSHRGGYSSSDYHSERREERAYYGRGGQVAYKERDTNRDSGSERQQPMLNGNTSPPPPTQRQSSASSTAPSKGKPIKSNIEAEPVKPSVNVKESSSVSSNAIAPVCVATPTPSAPAATTAPSTASNVVASPPAEAGEHVKTWANVAGQGSKKIVQTAAVQSQLERKSKDLAMQEKEKERRAAAVRAPRGGGVSRGSERGGYSGRGAGGGRGGNGFVGSTSQGRGQRRPDFRPGEHQGSSYRGGRGGGGDRGAYNRDNKDDHQPTDVAKREPAQYRDSQSASSSTLVPATPAAARAK